jgi:hypothetical protein
MRSRLSYVICLVGWIYSIKSNVVQCHMSLKMHPNSYFSLIVLKTVKLVENVLGIKCMFCFLLQLCSKHSPVIHNTWQAKFEMHADMHVVLSK